MIKQLQVHIHREPSGWTDEELVFEAVEMVGDQIAGEVGAEEVGC